MSVVFKDDRDVDLGEGQRVRVPCRVEGKVGWGETRSVLVMV